MKDSIKTPNWDGSETCASIGVDLFYDEDRRNVAETRQHLGFLRDICNSCHRLNECREYAIKHEYYGFWGGMTVTERREYRKKYKIELVRPEMFSDCLPKFERGVQKDDNQYATD